MNQDAAPITRDFAEFASEKLLIPDADHVTEGSGVSRTLNPMPKQSGTARIRVRSCRSPGWSDTRTKERLPGVGSLSRCYCGVLKMRFSL
jgi:hypothetical protein